ncbi:MAG: terpene synthase family protein [Myxococcota bacterium]
MAETLAAAVDSQSRDCLPTCSMVEIDLGSANFLDYQSDLKGQVLCLPKLAPHAKEEEIQARHEQWAMDVGLWRRENLASLEALQFSTLWTDCVPECKPEVAALIPDYCVMITIVDDTAERFFGQRRVAGFDLLQKVFANYRAVLEGSDDVPEIDYPQYRGTCAALVDLRERTRAVTTPTQYEQFVSGMCGYFRGVLQQVYLSSKRLPLSRETQISNREINVGFRPTVVLVASVLGIELSPRVQAHPLFDRVLRAIDRLGGVINDIISFKKEVEANAWMGQYHNLIAAEFNELVRENSPGNRLEIAFRRVFQFHNNEMYDFLRCGALIIEDHPEFREFHELCTSMHRSWMDWCLTVDRYSDSIPDGIKTNEVVHSLEGMHLPRPGSATT